MIDVVKTIQNFKELMPDLTVDKALALIECIVENPNTTQIWTYPQYPYNRDIMYTNQTTCTDSPEQIKLKAAPHL
jgi:hypothetical protein